MHKFTPAMAEQVSTAAMAFQLERTGHAPSAATVVLSGDTLVITLHEALSEAERVLSRTSEGAARVQAFHRELFGIWEYGFWRQHLRCQKRDSGKPSISLFEITYLGKGTYRDNH